VAVLDLGQDGAGRRRRRWVTAKSKAAVLQQLADLRAKVLDGAIGDPSRATTAQFLGRWLEDVARTTVGPKSYQLYELMVRRHIVPNVGQVPLSKLTPMHLQALLAAMERVDASPRLRQLALSIASRALRQAVKWHMLPRNPADAVAPPRMMRPEIHPLTPDQVTMLLQTAHDDRLHALYSVALGTGMRQGELLGLRWEDVDLAGGCLHVRRQLHEVSGRLWLGDVKTARARRRIDLPSLAVEALRAHRQRMLTEGHAPHRDALVFCDTEGGPIRKSNLVRRSFHPLVRRAGLPPTRFHDLRHTHATLLLQQGVHPKVVAERLGHSTISITLDTYSHVLPSLGAEAARRFDALLAAPQARGAAVEP
jgi:integrase